MCKPDINVYFQSLAAGKEGHNVSAQVSKPRIVSCEELPEGNEQGSPEKIMDGDTCLSWNQHRWLFQSRDI